MKKPFDNDAQSEFLAAARADAIPVLTGFVSSYARDMAFEEGRIGEIRMALEEALVNIIRFACPLGTEEIKITCGTNDMGALLVTIVDSGVPFNMLVMSAFPETIGEGSKPEDAPPTKAMKRAVKDIEYRRDGEKKQNILVWVVWN